MCFSNAKAWPKNLLDRINPVLVEFVTHLKQKDGSDVMQTTLKITQKVQYGFETLL